MPHEKKTAECSLESIGKPRPPFTIAMLQQCKCRIKKTGLPWEDLPVWKLNVVPSVDSSQQICFCSGCYTVSWREMTHGNRPLNRSGSPESQCLRSTTLMELKASPPCVCHFGITAFKETVLGDGVGVEKAQGKGIRILRANRFSGVPSFSHCSFALGTPRIPISVQKYLHIKWAHREEQVP